MANLVDDAKNAINKLDKIQMEFEEENKKLDEFVNKGKRISDDLNSIYENFETRVDDYLSQLSKINAIIKKYSELFSSSIDDINVQLETKTRNNLQIAQNNLNSLNAELNNYVNNINSQITLFFDNVFKEKEQEISACLNEKIGKLEEISFDYSKQINDLIDTQRNEYALLNKRLDEYEKSMKETSKNNNKGLIILLLILVIVAIILCVMNLFIE